MLFKKQYICGPAWALSQLLKTWEGNERSSSLVDATQQISVFEI